METPLKDGQQLPLLTPKNPDGSQRVIKQIMVIDPNKLRIAGLDLKMAEALKKAKKTTGIKSKEDKLAIAKSVLNKKLKQALSKKESVKPSIVHQPPNVKAIEEAANKLSVSKPSKVVSVKPIPNIKVACLTTLMPPPASPVIQTPTSANIQIVKIHKAEQTKQTIEVKIVDSPKEKPQKNIEIPKASLKAPKAPKTPKTPKTPKPPKTPKTPVNKKSKKVIPEVSPDPTITESLVSPLKETPPKPDKESLPKVIETKILSPEEKIDLKMLKANPAVQIAVPKDSNQSVCFTSETEAQTSSICVPAVPKTKHQTAGFISEPEIQPDSICAPAVSKNKHQTVRLTSEPETQTASSCEPTVPKNKLQTADFTSETNTETASSCVPVVSKNKHQTVGFTSEPQTQPVSSCEPTVPKNKHMTAGFTSEPNPQTASSCVPVVSKNKHQTVGFTSEPETQTGSTYVPAVPKKKHQIAGFTSEPETQPASIQTQPVPNQNSPKPLVEESAVDFIHSISILFAENQKKAKPVPESLTKACTEDATSFLVSLFDAQNTPKAQKTVPKMSPSKTEQTEVIYTSKTLINASPESTIVTHPSPILLDFPQGPSNLDLSSLSNTSLTPPKRDSKSYKTSPVIISNILIETSVYNPREFNLSAVQDHKDIPETLVHTSKEEKKSVESADILHKSLLPDEKKDMPLETETIKVITEQPASVVLKDSKTCSTPTPSVSTRRKGIKPMPVLIPKLKKSRKPSTIAQKQTIEITKKHNSPEENSEKPLEESPTQPVNRVSKLIDSTEISCTVSPINSEATEHLQNSEEHSQANEKSTSQEPPQKQKDTLISIAATEFDSQLLKKRKDVVADESRDKPQATDKSLSTRASTHLPLDSVELINAEEIISTPCKSQPRKKKTSRSEDSGSHVLVETTSVSQPQEDNALGIGSAEVHTRPQRMRKPTFKAAENNRKNSDSSLQLVGNTEEATEESFCKFKEMTNQPSDANTSARNEVLVLQTETVTKPQRRRKDSLKSRNFSGEEISIVSSMSPGLQRKHSIRKDPSNKTQSMDDDKNSFPPSKRKNTPKQKHQAPKYCYSMENEKSSEEVYAIQKPCQKAPDDGDESFQVPCELSTNVKSLQPTNVVTDSNVAAEQVDAAENLEKPESECIPKSILRKPKTKQLTETDSNSINLLSAQEILSAPLVFEDKKHCSLLRDTKDEDKEINANLQESHSDEDSMPLARLHGRPSLLSASDSIQKLNKNSKKSNKKHSPIELTESTNKELRFRTSDDHKKIETSEEQLIHRTTEEKNNLNRAESWETINSLDLATNQEAQGEEVFSNSEDVESVSNMSKRTRAKSIINLRGRVKRAEIKSPALLVAEKVSETPIANFHKRRGRPWKFSKAHNPASNPEEECVQKSEDTVITKVESTPILQTGRGRRRNLKDEMITSNKPEDSTDFESKQKSEIKTIDKVPSDDSVQKEKQTTTQEIEEENMTPKVKKGRGRPRSHSKAQTTTLITSYENSVDLASTEKAQSDQIANCSQMPNDQLESITTTEDENRKTKEDYTSGKVEETAIYTDRDLESREKDRKEEVDNVTIEDHFEKENAEKMSLEKIKKNTAPRTYSRRTTSVRTSSAVIDSIEIPKEQDNASEKVEEFGIDKSKLKQMVVSEELPDAKNSEKKDHPLHFPDKDAIRTAIENTEKTSVSDDETKKGECQENEPLMDRPNQVVDGLAIKPSIQQDIVSRNERCMTDSIQNCSNDTNASKGEEFSRVQIKPLKEMTSQSGTEEHEGKKTSSKVSTTDLQSNSDGGLFDQLKSPTVEHSLKKTESQILETDISRTPETAKKVLSIDQVYEEEDIDHIESPSFSPICESSRITSDHDDFEEIDEDFTSLIIDTVAAAEEKAKSIASIEKTMLLEKEPEVKQKNKIARNPFRKMKPKDKENPTDSEFLGFNEKEIEEGQQSTTLRLSQSEDTDSLQIDTPTTSTSQVKKRRGRKKIVKEDDKKEKLEKQNKLEKNSANSLKTWLISSGKSVDDNDMKANEITEKISSSVPPKKRRSKVQNCFELTSHEQSSVDLNSLIDSEGVKESSKIDKKEQNMSSKTKKTLDEQMNLSKESPSKDSKTTKSRKRKTVCYEQEELTDELNDSKASVKSTKRGRKPKVKTEVSDVIIKEEIITNLTPIKLESRKRKRSQSYDETLPNNEPPNKIHFLDPPKSGVGRLKSSDVRIPKMPRINTPTRKLNKTYKNDTVFNPRLLLIRKKEELKSDEPLYDPDLQTEPTNEFDIQCALCMGYTSKKKWYQHVSNHYGVGWIQGTIPPININSRSAVLQFIIDFFKVSKVKGLNCRLCQTQRRSGLGLLMHLEQCCLTGEEILETRVNCENCGRSYSKASYGIHKRTCLDPKLLSPEKVPEEPNTSETVSNDEVLSNTGRAKRKSVIKAETKLKTLEDSDFIPDEFIKFVSHQRNEMKEKTWLKDINSFGKGFCTQKKCSFTATTVGELMDHCQENVCSFYEVPGYHCTHQRCKFHAETVEIVRSHVVEKHKPKPIDDFKESDDDAAIESSSSDNTSSGVDEGENEPGLDGEQSTKRKKKAKTRKKARQVKFSSQPTKDFKKLLPERIPDIIGRVAGWYEEFFNQHFSTTPLFTYATSNPSHVEVSESYFPKSPISMKFLHNGFNGFVKEFSETKVEPDRWKQLERLQGSSEKSEYILYMGGPVKCFAWVPMYPHPPSTTQYLAVTIRKGLNKFSRYPIAKRSRSLIYIIKYETNSTELKAKIHYAIAINEGPIHAIEFLPSGGFAPEMNRMGLLAVGTVETEIKIYSLPLVVEKQDCDNFPIIRLESSLELHIQLSGASNEFMDSYQSPCTCLAWSQTAGHNLIFGGYANGFVGIWDLTDDDCNLNRLIVNEKRTFIPISYFWTLEDRLLQIVLHYDINGPRWLAATNSLRTVLLYDLRDITQPVLFYVDVTKNVVNCIDWPVVWENLSIGLGNTMPSHGCIINVVSPMNIMYSNRRFEKFCTGVTSMSYSIWKNSYAAGTENGDIQITPLKEAVLDVAQRLKIDEKTVTTLDIVSLNGGTISRKGLQMPPDGQRVFETDYNNQYGLVFGSVRRVVGHKKPELYSAKRDPPFNLYPLMRVSQIKFNQSRNVSDLLAVGYDNGFLRVLRDDWHTKLKDRGE